MNISQSNSYLKGICSRHDTPYSYIHINNDSENPTLNRFMCVECIIDDNISGKYLLSASTIVKNPKAVYQQWPYAIDPKIVDRLKDLIKKPEDSYNKIKDQISQHFKQFKEQILVEIDRVEQKIKKEAETIIQLEVQILKSYYQNSKQSEMRTILNNINLSSQEQEKQLEEIVDEVIKNKEQAASQLNDLYNQLDRYKNNIENNLIQSSSEEIFGQIRNMTIQSDLKGIIQQDSIKQESFLVSKLNEELSEMGSESARNMEVSSMNQSMIDVSNLENQQVLWDELDKKEKEEVYKFMRIIIDGKKEKQKSANLEKFNLFLTPKNIMSVIRSPQNLFDSASTFFRQVEIALNSIPQYLACFLIPNQREMPNQIPDHQMQRIMDLMKQIKFLSTQYNNNYSEGAEPLQQQQPNSKAVMDLLIAHENVLGDQDSGYKKGDLAKLLVDFPIFELIKMRKCPYTPLRLEFVRTRFKQSQEFSISPQGNSICVKIEQNIQGQVVLDYPLENKLYYCLRFSLNKKERCNAISVGIIEKNKANIRFVNGNGQQGYWSNPPDGVNTIIKGNSIYNGEFTDIEMRFCIEKQEFYLADFPEYQNINRVEGCQLDPSREYCLGIGMHTPGPNWAVTVHYLHSYPSGSDFTFFT